MTPSEVQQLLRDRDSRICARGYEGADGTLLLGDKTKRTTRILISVLTAAMSVAAASPQAITTNQSAQPQHKAELGVTITVTDPNGAVIPKTEIVLQSLQDGTVYTGTTDDFGVWKRGEIKAGTYKLSISALGFKNEESEVKLTPGLAIAKSLTVGTSMLMGVLVSDPTLPIPQAEIPLTQIELLPLGGKPRKGMIRR